MIGEVKVRQEIVLSVLDHYKRNKVQKLSTSDVVFGGIQGRVVSNVVVFEKCFEVAWKETCKSVDEDFLSAKIDIEKQVNPEQEIVGFYIVKQGFDISSEVAQVFKAFHKKSELMYAFLLDPKKRTTKEDGPAIKVFEPSLQTDFKEVRFSLSADPSEIICINDILREISGGDGYGSGYLKGMKTWQNSFQNYTEKLTILLSRLESKDPISSEELRQIKEIVINFPSEFAEINSLTLEEKFITANIMNTMTSIFKFSRIHEKLVNQTQTKK